MVSREEKAKNGGSFDRDCLTGHGHYQVVHMLGACLPVLQVRSIEATWPTWLDFNPLANRRL